jgi:anaerobic dimethyl sulfoxide reductase subunit A
LLQELQEHVINMNTIDAEPRGIKDGDMVMVFNDRGKLVIRAHIMERIMPGVVDIGEGAWYAPDDNGVDRGGCANVLTSDQISPGGAVPYNTALVQVQKFEE